MEKFEKGETLTAERLNELVQGLEAVEVPAAPAPARKAARATYAPANYNTAELVERGWEDEVEYPDYMGLVGAVGFARGIHSSVIRSGEIMLPLAQTRWQSDPEAGSTPGLVYGVEFDAVEEPLIKQGSVVLPYANSDGCEGVATAGVLRDVRVDPEAVDPSIAAGVLVLPPSEGLQDIAHCQPVDGWGVRDGVAYVPLCHEDVCNGTAGVVSGVRVDGWSETPSLSNGVVLLPFTPAGMEDEYGKQHSWLALRYAGSPVRMDAGDASRLGYSVQVTSSGMLKLYIDRA